MSSSVMFNPEISDKLPRRSRNNCFEKLPVQEETLTIFLSSITQADRIYIKIENFWTIKLSEFLCLNPGDVRKF